MILNGAVVVKLCLEWIHTKIFKITGIAHYFLVQGMESTSVDRLRSVSRLSSDPRVQALLRENQKLKLSLFWKDHNIIHLEMAMGLCNISNGGPNCSCIACGKGGRTADHATLTHGPCAFKPYFKSLAKKHGLVTLYTGWRKRIQHEAGDWNGVEDLDTHLVIIRKDDWFSVEYGSKLWKATHVDDPELKRLGMFFADLLTCGNNENRPV